MCLFFFFKQKTAYEMLRSLVGSEMCIRDRHMGYPFFLSRVIVQSEYLAKYLLPACRCQRCPVPVSYTHLTLPTIYSV